MYSFYAIYPKHLVRNIPRNHRTNRKIVIHNAKKPSSLHLSCRLLGLNSSRYSVLRLRKAVSEQKCGIFNSPYYNRKKLLPYSPFGFYSISQHKKRKAPVLRYHRSSRDDSPPTPLITEHRGFSLN